MRITLLITVIICCLGSSYAQEKLTGLVVNPKVKEAAARINAQKKAVLQVGTTLPFFDDFSRDNAIFPDQSKWSDRYVFINSDFALNPPTVGVATFDAINDEGQIYSHAGPFPFGADTLTSVEIRLDSLFSSNPRRISRADSLYLSFYYQPQGLGNSPSERDSLILEFLAPDEDIIVYIPADTVVTGTDTIIYPADTIIYESWVRVWSSTGETMESFYNTDSLWFKQVFIPILDSSRFYKPDFKFRFLNYASLADATLPDWQSNGDQWNIDYVYLNIDRTILDRSHPDVAFASDAPSMLRYYTSMPYDHYRRDFVNEMAQSVEMKISNLGNEIYNSTYRYEVTNTEGNLIHIYDGGSYNISPYADSGYLDFDKFSNPDVDFIFPINDPEPVIFNITHILDVQVTQPKTSNDTVIYNQTFSNYFAYDDGTAEAGYGITPSGAQVAYKFQLNKNDSLFGVHMFFNQTLSQGNVHPFYLNIWNDEFGKPGELLYSRYGYEPVLTDSLNKFFYYELDSVINIEPGRFPNLIFYIGWEQSNESMLNLGFDRNNNASGRIFYKTFGDWSTSQYQGALMIRPVIGTDKVLAMGEKSEAGLFRLYPNPLVGGVIRIKTKISKSDFSRYKVQFSSTDGKIIKSLPLSEEINIGELANGIYFVHITDMYGIIGTEKLIINH